MKEIRFAGEIHGGKLIIYSREALNADLSCAKDQRIVGSIKTVAKKRTLKQNGVLHWYIGDIADHTGMDGAQVKRVLQYKFTQRPVLDDQGHEMFDPETGEIFTEVPSSADLSTIEMNDFCEKIRIWALDYLKLLLPLPNEQGELKFDENGNIESKR